MMRLYYHPESDGLWWDRRNFDSFVEDVTDVAKFQDAAAARGIICPGEITPNPRTAKEMIVTAEVTSSKNGSVADAIIKSYKAWERKPSDIYPTPVEATEALIPMLKAMKRPDGSPVQTVWEPSCGDGRISRVLEYHGFKVFSSDLREYPGWGVGGFDFVNDDPTEAWGWDGSVDVIIGNPPFSLAEEFIRKAREYCPNVVMLLKQTFWNVGGRSKGLWKDETPSIELKLTWRLAFLKKERGNSPLMDCMWAVWLADHIAEDSAGQGYCVTEPLAKKTYPGYADIGFMPALQVLEGELDELTKLISSSKLLRGG